MNQKIAFALIVIVILLIIYYFQYDANHINGFWVGSPQFLLDTDIRYIGADFADGILTILIKITEDNSITQIYNYIIDDTRIKINASLITGGKYILPDGELSLKYDDDELHIYDDQTTYLILVKL